MYNCLVFSMLKLVRMYSSQRLTALRCGGLDAQTCLNALCSLNAQLFILALASPYYQTAVLGWRSF